MRRSGLLLLFALLGVAGGGIVGTARGQLAAQVGALEFEREAAESAAEYTKDTMNGYEDGKAAIRGAARAASNYMAAATCCPGCSYYSTCCCAPGGGNTRTVVITRTEQAGKRAGAATVKPGMAVRIARQQEDSESEIVLVPLGARGGPESRMLCPACPADASVAKGTLFNRMFGRDYSYCCPGAPVWAITRTRTATQTQTMTAGGGGGGSAGGGSTGKAVHRGQAWYDNNNDKKYTPGADKLVANQWVILWLPNGQILGRAKTDSKGAYSMQSKVYKSTKLSISLLKAPTQPIMSFWTGKNGNSRVVMPVPPPRISGRVYRKTTRKVAGRAKNEVVGKPLANSFVLIKFAVNGTLWKRVPTDSQGRYNWAYSGTTGKRYPFLQILILSPDSKIMKASRLDGNGNGAIKDVVLPPATKVKPHIKGRVYWEATGQPAVREVITIRRADRTVVRRVTTDANGRFDFTTMPGAYVSEQLEVIDARGNRVATFTTNADGSGSVLCPLPAIPSPPPPPPPAQTTRKPVAPTSPVVPVTTARPIVGGTLELHAFVDVNRNLEYDDGDKDLANSDLEIRWPNGTLLKRFTLDDLGMYSFAAGPFPNEPFAVLFLTGQQIGSVTTDSAGSVRAKIRIPPPAAEIDGMLYVDQNGDSSYDSGDTPLANSQVDLKLPNGTLLGRVRTNSAGKFNLITLGTTYAGVELTVSMTATGQVLQTITTDESGKGVADIALSSDTAVIQGSVFVDVDGDSAPSAGDLPSVGTTIVVLFPNGTELARVRTDDAGLFSFPAAARYPGVDFDVVSTSGQVLATFTTDTSGNGRVDVALSAQVPTLGGSLFYDLDGNGAFDPAKDGAMTNKPVVLRFPNGTVYQTLATDSMGRFNVAPGGVTYPNMIFSVLSASGAVLGSLQTDATGSGDALIPLRPALIQGSAWTDANRDTVRNPTEAPLANSVLTIRWNNGTVLTQVSTDSTGRYSLPLIPYPNQKFIIEGPDGVGSKSFTTDAAGNAAANLAIVPGATTATPTRTMASATETRADPLPLLGGKVFIDLNKDGVWTPGSDQPIGNETVALFFPNGTIHGTAITLADGTFAVPLTIFPRNEILTVVLASDPTFAAGTISTDAVGAGYSHVALPPPTISGTIYVDTNADGRLGDADMPLRLEPLVLLFSNGSVYSSVTSLANATFAMDPALPWAPNEDITVVRALDPAVPVGSFKTNSMGSGRIDILLPPPTITGQIWIDSNLDSRFDNATDAPLANRPLELRFANGKVYVAVTTDWNGVFSLVPDVAAPNEVLYLVELSGLVYGNLTLDSIGAGNIDVPLPPPSIHADVFYDTNGDGILNGDDMPYGSKPVQIRGPNGTILGNLMTNSMGNINGTIAALFPGQPIQIIDPLTGAVLGTGTTDSKGNILVTVALRLTMSLTSTKPLAPIPTSAVPTTPSAPTPTSAVPTNPPAVATSTSTPSNNPPVAVPTTTLVPVPSAVPTSMAPTAAVTTDVAFSTVTPPPLPATSAAPLPVTPAPPSTTIVVTSMMMPTPTTTPTATQSATQSTTQSTTWSATSTSATQTSTSATQTLPPPVVGGTVFVDINKDGAFTPGVDQLFANETVALYFSNGSFYSYAITLPNGTFSMADLIPAPNEILTVVLALDPASAAGTITTDAFGNGVTNVALPPPIIAGNLFVDMNSDGGLNDGDVPLGLETVVLLFPNGSVYANMVTSPNGAFTLDPALPIAPYQNLVMIRASSPTSPVANLVTDFRGGAEIDVPLPAPAITGQLWIDLDLDSQFDSTKDTPFANQTLALRFPNGTDYTTITTEFTGAFSTSPAIAAPGQLVYLVDALTGKVHGNLTLDSTGAGSVEVPIPPPLISVNLFYDANGDGLNAGELPYAFKPVLIRAQGGIPLATLTTDSLGNINGTVPAVLPGQSFEIVDPVTGSVLGNGVTDGQGSVIAAIPVPVPTTTSRTTTAAPTTTVTETTTTVTATATINAPTTNAPPSTTAAAFGATTAPAPPSPTTAAPAATTQSTTSVTKIQTTSMPVLGGRVFIDMDKDGTLTPGTDQPIGNETLILFYPNSSIYAVTNTLANGSFAVPIGPNIPPAPNAVFTIVLASDPATVAGTVSTDQFGGALANVAVPPPVISGSIFVDTNANRGFDDTDMPLPGEHLALLFSNGSVYASVTTAPNSTFILDPALPWAPNENMTVVRALDPVTPVGSFMTNSIGSGVIDIALPLPAIMGQIWNDTDSDSSFDSTIDTPLANWPLGFRLANGTVYASTTTDSNGAFSAVSTILAPGQTLDLVDPASSTVYGTVTLDSIGAGYVDVPIPP